MRAGATRQGYCPPMRWLETTVTVVVLAAVCGGGETTGPATTHVSPDTPMTTAETVGDGAATTQTAIDDDTRTAREIAERAMKIAAGICVYTNENVVIETL